jgi:hypothetical protein
VNESPELKICSRCGASLECGAKLNACWCQTLPPLPAARLNDASDCYCPRCLGELTQGLTPEPEHVV